MVGGTVVEVCEVPGRPDVLFVDCADMPRGRTRPDTCAVHVERSATSERIDVGDGLWWQGSLAYWTPLGMRMSQEEHETAGHRSGVDYDIPINRVGFSGVGHPSREGP